MNIKKILIALFFGLFAHVAVAQNYGALQAQNNLSELTPTQATARTNIGAASALAIGGLYSHAAVSAAGTSTSANQLIEFQGGSTYTYNLLSPASAAVSSFASYVLVNEQASAVTIAIPSGSFAGATGTCGAAGGSSFSLAAGTSCQIFDTGSTWISVSQSVAGGGGGGLTAQQLGSLANSSTVSGAGTSSTPNTVLQFTGAGGYTYNLPAPTASGTYAYAQYVLYNSGSGAVNISIPSGSFEGPSGTCASGGGTSFSLAAGASCQITSTGTQWLSYAQTTSSGGGGGGVTTAQLGSFAGFQPFVLGGTSTAPNYVELLQNSSPYTLTAPNGTGTGVTAFAQYVLYNASVTGAVTVNTPSGTFSGGVKGTCAANAGGSTSITIPIQVACEIVNDGNGGWYSIAESIPNVSVSYSGGLTLGNNDTILMNSSGITANWGTSGANFTVQGSQPFQIQNNNASSLVYAPVQFSSDYIQTTGQSGGLAAVDVIPTASASATYPANVSSALIEFTGSTPFTLTLPQAGAFNAPGTTSSNGYVSSHYELYNNSTANVTITSTGGTVFSGAGAVCGSAFESTSIVGGFPVETATSGASFTLTSGTTCELYRVGNGYLAIR